MIDEHLMQFHAAYRDPGRARKIRAGRMFGVHELDSPEWKGIFGRQRDAKHFESGDTVGQDAFSAGFVDRRHASIHYGRLQTLSAGGNRRNDSRWPRSDNEDFTLFFHN